jgi:iron complex outermembrane recepter protein
MTSRRLCRAPPSARAVRRHRPIRYAPTFAGRLAKYQAYDPETVNDIEAGVRTDWRLTDDVRLRFNASAFMGWYKNVITSLSQVTTSTAACLATGPDTVVNPLTGRLASPDGDCNPNNDPISGAMSINAGKTRVRGIDIDGFIGFGRHFKLTYAANWMKPQSRSVDIPDELKPYSTSKVIGFDFVAKNTYSLGAAYNTELGSFGELGASVDFYHSSPTSFTDIKFSSYNIVNARVELNNVGGMPVDLSVYATNLFDEEYVQAGAFNGPNAGVGASIFGAPAQYGASIRYRFGK